jgi:DNA-directed RNA polymerase subunit RPC12/RpoP
MSDRENYTGYDCADCGHPLQTLSELTGPCRICGGVVAVLSLDMED